MARLSILGMYRLCPDLFDGFQVPSGMSFNNVRDSILLETAELEILYPEPETMREAIRLWTYAELPQWEKLWATTQLEYNPIWNVDGTVRETETRDLKKDENISNTGHTEATGSAVTQVEGFDSADWKDAEKVETANEADVTNGSISTGAETGTVTHEMKRTGNIGVTTTQHMIAEEREVAAFNMTEYIVQSFKKRFCLLVY